MSVTIGILRSLCQNGLMGEISNNLSKITSCKPFFKKFQMYRRNNTNNSCRSVQIWLEQSAFCIHIAWCTVTWSLKTSSCKRRARIEYRQLLEIWVFQSWWETRLDRGLRYWDFLKDGCPTNIFMLRLFRLRLMFGVWDVWFSTFSLTDICHGANVKMAVMPLCVSTKKVISFPG